MYPAFRGSRTLKDGHVFRPGIPPWAAPALMQLVEKAKFIVRLRKKTLLHLRALRARLEDALQKR
jgi:hypothetical protein